MQNYIDAELLGTATYKSAAGGTNLYIVDLRSYSGGKYQVL